MTKAMMTHLNMSTVDLRGTWDETAKHYPIHRTSVACTIEAHSWFHLVVLDIFSPSGIRTYLFLLLHAILFWCMVTSSRRKFKCTGTYRLGDKPFIAQDGGWRRLDDHNNGGVPLVSMIIVSLRVIIYSIIYFISEEGLRIP